MINGILQFIKKTILAIKLARHDALFVVSKLKSFAPQMMIARWFVTKTSNKPMENLRHFLESENNLFLNAAVDEVTSRSDIVGKNNFYLFYSEPRKLRREVLFKTTAQARDKSFYLKLFAEIVRKDCPELQEQLSFFRRRLDILLDMRFYASELEELNKAAGGYGSQNFFEVDWIRSSREKLYFMMEQDSVLTNQLESYTQEDLVGLFGYLFFEKNWFISSWQGVAVTADGKAGLLDFDYLYPVNDDFKSFVKAWFTEPQAPKNVFEYKLVRALKVLQLYCPDIDIAKSWSGYLSASHFDYKVHEHSSKLLQNLQKYGVVTAPSSDVTFADPKDLAYLLDSRHHKNDPRYRKSTIWYWGPLLMMIYVLYHYF